MSPHLLRIPGEARPIDYETQVSANPALSFAVFDGDTLLGVVDSRAAFRSPHRTFADLCRADPSPPIPDSSRPEEILAEMDRRQADILPVIQADGRLLGVVSRSGMTEFLLKRIKHTEILLTVSQAVGSTLDLTEMMRRVARETARVLGADMVGAFLADPDQQHLRPIAGYHVPTRLLEAFRTFPIPLKGHRALEEAWTHHRAVYSSDAAADPRTDRETLDRFPQRSTLFVPMIVKGKPIGGFFATWWEQKHDFTHEEVRLVEGISRQAAVAIENAHLYEETERGRRAAESLAEVQRLISQSLDPEVVGQRIVESVLTLLRVHDSVLWRLEPESGDLVRVVFSGNLEPGLGPAPILPRGTRAAGLAVSERRPVASSDILTDPRITLTPEMRARLEQAADRAVLAVPLIVQDRVVGALGAGGRTGRVFADEEVRLLEAFASHAAIALDNARLHQELRCHQARLQALQDASRDLSRLQPVQSVLTSILQACGGLLGTDSVGFRLVEGDELVVMGASGDAQEAMSTPRLKIGESLSGRVAATGEPLLVTDLPNDPRLLPAHREADRRLGHRAYLGVPMKVGERVVGVLSARTRREEGFSKEDVAIATAFASQAAVALDNSRLYGELRSALEEIKASQEQLVRGERLKALGELAGGVAHDFNNTLAVILGRAQFLLSQTEDPNLQRQLRVIEKAAQDGARTVRRIQEFTRMRPARPHQTVDLNRVIQEAVELARPRWMDEAQAGGIHYEILVEPAPLPPVAGDPAELREAVTNLLFNALEAMRQGGRVTFRTAVEGERVCCVVSDTGVGMPEEVKQRVFDPFFTTKVKKGSGLGLSIVYGIIARHGGEIEVQSRPGQGSAFTIRLPGGRDTPQAPPSAPPVGPRRTGRILVIDDEEEVREILCELLASRGHSVAACADGASGLTRLQEEPFDLVITDLGMPGISGWEVARQVRLSRPGTPVALVTGWGDRIDPEEARAKGVDFLVTKPFDFEAIAGVVAHTLTREDRATG